MLFKEGQYVKEILSSAKVLKFRLAENIRSIIQTSSYTNLKEVKETKEPEEITDENKYRLEATKLKSRYRNKLREKSDLRERSSSVSRENTSISHQEEKSIKKDTRLPSIEKKTSTSNSDIFLIASPESSGSQTFHFNDNNNEDAKVIIPKQKKPLSKKHQVLKSKIMPLSIHDD